MKKEGIYKIDLKKQYKWDIRYKQDRRGKDQIMSN